MQVKLNEESQNILIERDKESEGYFNINIDSRVSVKVSKTELKFMHALIGALLEDNPRANKDGLRKVMVEALSTHRPKFQDALRKMKQEEIAFAVWYAGDMRVSQEILKHMSKRSAEDVQAAVRETIERRIRKERSEGNTAFEGQMEEYGKNAVTALLKLVFDSDTIPM